MQFYLDTSDTAIRKKKTKKKKTINFHFSKAVFTLKNYRWDISIARHAISVYTNWLHRWYPGHWQIKRCYRFAKLHTCIHVHTRTCTCPCMGTYMYEYVCSCKCLCAFVLISHKRIDSSTTPAPCPTTHTRFFLLDVSIKSTRPENP